MNHTVSLTALREKVLSQLECTGFQAIVGQLRKNLGHAIPIYLVGGFVRDCAPPDGVLLV